MGPDRREYEPDEYDPEEEFRDPDSDSITIPQLPTENAGSSLSSDLRSELKGEEAAADVSDIENVPGELLTDFWALVIVINAAVVAYALGLLFLFFEGATTIAGYLVAAGLVLTGFAIRRYRSVKESEYGPTDEDPAETDRSPETGDSAGDGGEDDTGTPNTDHG